MDKSINQHFARFLAACAAFLLSLPSAWAQIKVACVGDSITAGYGLANAGTQSYPAQLQLLLGSGYTVGNFGLSAATLLKQSDFTYWNTSQHTSSLAYNPDIVVIMLGTNDTKSWNWNATNFAADYQELIAQYQALSTQPKVYICLSPPVYTPNAFGTTFDPAFVQNTLIPAIQTVATSNGVRLIENNTPLLNHPELFSDGVHPTTQGAGVIASTVAEAMAVALPRHSLTSTGSAAPIPGPNDISQLAASTTTRPDGLNYYTDNSAPAGQTFTTGPNAMDLVSLTVKTAGVDSGNGYGTPASTPTYYLRIYSISGSTATLLLNLSSPNPGFTSGDWLKWDGLKVRLEANKTYAYSFGIRPSNGGWAALSVVAANAYAGGEIAMIPINGGAITTGASHGFDATFTLGLQTPPPPIPASTPWPVPTYGMNVGNCLELDWGPPNLKLFYAAVQNGFNAVRIPCAWDYAGATTTTTGGVTNYVIDPAYMTQVKQTVDAALAAGMYVVINSHWDGGWLQSNLGTTVDPVVNAKVKDYWTQIATTFAGYDNHLLFAATNEPDVASPAVMTTLMVYYQTFVKTVRAVGGNNTDRWLVLQGGGDTTWLSSLPIDSTPNRLMLEYHNYTPFQFTQMQGDASWGPMLHYWGPAYHYDGDPSHNCSSPEEGAIDAGFQQLVDQYVSKGIPVMIGEFQAAAKSVLSTSPTERAWNRASAYYWNKYLVDSALAHGMSPFYWSTGDSPFSYTTGAVVDPEMVGVLTGGVAPPPPNGAPYAASGLTAMASGNTVTLSWTAGSGATSYSLYRSAASGGESGIAPFITGITGTSYTDTNLNSGTTYYYQVVAVNASGPTGFSPEAHATTTGVNPDPTKFHFETDPQGWESSGGATTGVATSTAQHYAGKQSLAVNISNTNSTSTAVRIGGVNILQGQTVTFRVWIPSGSTITSIQPYMQDRNWTWTGGNWNGNLTANAWNTVTLTVPANAVVPFQYLNLQFNLSGAWTGTCYLDSVNWTTPAPPVPAGLAAVAGAGQITLNWSASATAANYFVKRSTTSGSGYVTIANAGNPTFTDTEVANGTTYYYVVTASNLYGASANSAQVSAIPGEKTARYAFEGNAQDSSGNGFHGTATSLTYVTGKIAAQAAQFNGTSSYVSIPPVVTDDYTVAMWVKTTDNAGWPGAQWWAGKGLVDGEVGGGGADWGTSLVDGKFVFGVGSIGGDTTLASSVNINDDAWHHVAATRNNTTGAMAVYVDGLPSGSGTGPTGSRTFTPGLRIGSLQTGNNFLNGTLDDVRLYDRILTGSEIAALVNKPPVLAAIGDSTVNVGQTVAFTAGVIDTDQPPQTLSFTLLAGPTNATLNPNSGAFSFRPFVTQANSTNNFTLEVSDNGSPPLSATRSFSVVVNPLVTPSISNITFAGGQFSLQVNGQTGPDYEIETSTDLTEWESAFTANSPAVPFLWTDPDTSGSAPRFYRIKLGPLPE